MQRRVVDKCTLNAPLWPSNSLKLKGRMRQSALRAAFTGASTLRVHQGPEPHSPVSLSLSQEPIQPIATSLKLASRCAQNATFPHPLFVYYLITGRFGRRKKASPASTVSLLERLTSDPLLSERSCMMPSDHGHQLGSFAFAPG